MHTVKSNSGVLGRIQMFVPLSSLFKQPLNQEFKSRGEQLPNNVPSAQILIPMVDKHPMIYVIKTLYVNLPLGELLCLYCITNFTLLLPFQSEV